MFIFQKYKRLISVFLVLVIVSGFFTTLFHKKTVPETEAFGTAIKEMVLDPIGYVIIQLVLDGIIEDTINWAESGFDGTPSFVSNPETFFLGVADKAAGIAISNYKDTEFLCSPFKIDLALTLNYWYERSKGPVEESCTLTQVIANVENAAEDLGEFLDGDFSKGGWPGWFEVTTAPQNAPLGAYLKAETKVGIAITTADGEEKSSLLMNSGFLSKKKCEKVDVPIIGTGQFHTVENCKIVTPGDTVANFINSNIGGGNETLLTADEFNELLGAVIAAFLKKGVTSAEGLFEPSKTADDDGNIAPNRFAQEIGGNSKDVKIKNDLRRFEQAYQSNEQFIDVLDDASGDYINDDITVDEDEVDLACFKREFKEEYDQTFDEAKAEIQHKVGRWSKLSSSAYEGNNQVTRLEGEYVCAARIDKNHFKEECRKEPLPIVEGSDPPKLVADAILEELEELKEPGATGRAFANGPRYDHHALVATTQEISLARGEARLFQRKLERFRNAKSIAEQKCPAPEDDPAAGAGRAGQR